MKSLYAVVGQLFLSASNYGIFLLLAVQLSSDEFIAFSTAVGLNMLAYAIAEGGVSYVAPRELAAENKSITSPLAGAFVSISLALYVIVMIIGYFIWNTFSHDQLDSLWVCAYAVYFIPSLMIPSWVTCWTIDFVGVVALGLIRCGMVISIYLFPSTLMLAGSGIVFILFVIGFISRLNNRELIITWANRQSFKTAIKKLREVFMAKTITYAVYGLMPLIVGILQGNAMSSAYVTGERIKSLYATLFQPVIQTLYLWQVQTNVSKLYRRVLVLGVNVFNFLIFIALLWAVDNEWHHYVGTSFSSIDNISLFLVAGFLSVVTSSLLYFFVFPLGNFKCFRRATIVQMFSFLISYTLMAFYESPLPVYILCIGEGIFFIAVCVCLMRKEQKEPVMV